MGNQNGCGKFCRRDNEPRENLLRSKYKAFLKGSKFREICLEILDKHFEEELELENQEFLRTSIIHGSHYEANSLVNSIESEDNIQFIKSIRKGSGEIEGDKLPTSIAGLPVQKREAYMLNLIRESYLFIDFSECLQERSSHESYEKYMKHELFRNDKALFQSFVTDSTLIDRLQQSLKLNYAEMICLLQGYVHFCRKVKYDFTLENQRFLGKLSVNLQAEIIAAYNYKQFRGKNQLLLHLREDIDEVISILVMTIETLYQIKIMRVEEEEQKPSAFDFYNEMNIYTMVTSLFFQSQSFSTFVLERIGECFEQRWRKFKKEGEYTTADFVQDFVNLTSKGTVPVERYRSEVGTLIDPSSGKYNKIGVFENSLRILPKIVERPEPLYKLKLVYELNREMNRQLQKLRQNLKEYYSVELGSVFNRESELLIVKWMLNQLRREIESLGSQLMMTYFFIHHMYRVDRKGSCLTTFMQQVQRIIQWNDYQ